MLTEISQTQKDAKCMITVHTTTSVWVHAEVIKLRRKARRAWAVAQKGKRLWVAVSVRFLDMAGDNKHLLAIDH